MNLYDALYLASTPASGLYFFYKYIFRGKYHESLPAMFGRRLPETPLPHSAGAPRIWVHAVSVGEIVAARAAVDQLSDLLPNPRFIISTVTETGQAMARKTLGDKAERILYYPIDLSWNVERFLDIYRPDVFIMMETELWPNMLNIAGRRAIPIFMLNGRISDHSYRSYRRFRSLFRGPLSNLMGAAVQTQLDADRLRDLAGPNPKIAVTGNCKFDSLGQPLSAAEKKAARERLLLSDDRTVVVAGCTHPGEEELILAAWREAAGDRSRTTLILAPRHPERARKVAAIVARNNLTCSFSDRPDKRDPEVVVLNEMGVLNNAYGIASIAMSCGSFAVIPRIAGHNILEPAVHAIPVIYGPYMNNQREMLRILDGDNGGIQVEAGELGATLRRLMRDPALRESHGRKVRAAIDANRGSARRAIEFILPHLPH